MARTFPDGVIYGEACAGSATVQVADDVAPAGAVTPGAATIEDDDAAMALITTAARRTNPFIPHPRSDRTPLRPGTRH